MPKVSAKRQITLPVDQCRQANIEPGDEYSSYVNNEGQITIVKKKAGAARAILQGVQAKADISDEQSRQSYLSNPRQP